MEVKTMPYLLWLEFQVWTTSDEILLSHLLRQITMIVQGGVVSLNDPFGVPSYEDEIPEKPLAS